MKLRTQTEISQAEFSIGYDTPVMFLGSCFAGEIGRQFSRGKMNVMVNPFGVLYNPYSTARALETIMEGKEFREEDLFYFNNRYLSFRHDTGFSSVDSSVSLSRINHSISSSESFLKRASVIFITFGTAWVYRFNENNEIVANCHKIPASKFTRQLLEIDDIVDYWERLLRKLKKYNPGLKIVFTVSPVRHLKDGAHGNQVSKSILLLAIERLREGDTDLSYFPSYEIVLDDLRDYRYYKKDMIHPSETAIEYIWEIFKKVYFKPETISIYKRLIKITESVGHRITGDDIQSVKDFSSTMLSKINELKNDFPLIDLGQEEDYFRKMVSDE